MSEHRQIHRQGKGGGKENGLLRRSLFWVRGGVGKQGAVSGDLEDVERGKRKEQEPALSVDRRWGVGEQGGDHPCRKRAESLEKNL